MFDSVADGMSFGSVIGMPGCHEELDNSTWAPKESAGLMCQPVLFRFLLLCAGRDREKGKVGVAMFWAPGERAVNTFTKTASIKACFSDDVAIVQRRITLDS